MSQKESIIQLNITAGLAEGEYMSNRNRISVESKTLLRKQADTAWENAAESANSLLEWNTSAVNAALEVCKSANEAIKAGMDDPFSKRLKRITRTVEKGRKLIEAAKGVQTEASDNENTGT